MMLKSRIVLQVDPHGHNGRNDAPTMVTLRSGRILLAYTRYLDRIGHDFSPGHIVQRYSDDEGRTWSSRDVPLVEQGSSTNVCCPSLLRLNDGRIALMYCRTTQKGRFCTLLFCVSDDEGKTFSKPSSLFRDPGYQAAASDALTQLRDGRIMVPVAMHRHRAPSRLVPVPVDARKPNGPTRLVHHGYFFAIPGHVLYYYSDDGGKTWLESLNSHFVCSQKGYGFSEPGVIELKDGRIWSWIRCGANGILSANGYQWETFSKDRGEVWSPARRSWFRSPASPMRVKRIPSTGHLLALWNDHSHHFRLPPPLVCSGGRTPLACAISRDDGRTWQHRSLLEKDPREGYTNPGMHFAGDAVLFGYTMGGRLKSGPLCSLRIRRVRLADLYRA